MAARFSAPIKPQFNVLGITAAKVLKWTPTLALWGVAAGGAGFLFLSSIPRFQRDVLSQLPVASYYADKTPDSDKPF